MALHSQHEEEGENAVWAITYGDLMSYLMIFFLFVYAFESQKPHEQAALLKAIQENFSGKKVQAQEPPKPPPPFEDELAAATELEQKLRLAKLQDVADVDSNDLVVRVTLKDKILFPSGSAELLPGAAKVLRDFAEVVRPMPNDLMVEGHTDNVRISRKLPFKSNWELSMARSLSIIKHLVENESLDPTRLAGVGYGEFRPLAPNTTEENRAQNRRIELTILRKRKRAASVAAPPEPQRAHERHSGG
ncbi:MAG: flagellar motor protein MotB [Elusimicrobia bacterium]|nr:flagellar motor protein MotB [Elusimicrobiota bacterium]